MFARMTGFTALCVISWSSTANGATATVQPQPRQEIKGWGLFPSFFYRDWGANSHMFDRPAAQEAVFALKPDVVRVELRHSVRNEATGGFVEARLQDLLDQIALAKSYGVERYILSAWSPPDEFKTIKDPNGCVDANDNGRCDGGEQIPRLAVEHEDAYATYFASVIAELGERGAALPEAVSFQNEPDYTPVWNGCFYDGIQWRRVARKVRQALDQAGLEEVVLLGPEGSGQSSTVYDEKYFGDKSIPGPAWPYLEESFEPMMGLPALQDAVGAFAFHSYNRCDVESNGEGAQEYPRDWWMTEWGHAPSSSGNDVPDQLEWAVNGARGLMADLEGLPFNYWFFWLGWHYGPNPNREYLIVGDEALQISKPYWVYKKIWEVVRPGWRVRGMTTDDPDLKSHSTGNDCDVLLDLLAFESPDKKALAVLAANPTANSKQLVLEGLVGDSATPYRTSESEDMAELTPIAVTDGQADLSMPAHSVTLLVAGEVTPAVDGPRDEGPGGFEPAPGEESDSDQGGATGLPDSNAGAGAGQDEAGGCGCKMSSRTVGTPWLFLVVGAWVALARVRRRSLPADRRVRLER